jgi:hypothetical protein
MWVLYSGHTVESMRYFWILCAAVAVVAALCVAPSSVGTAMAATSPSCWRSVACAGQPVTSTETATSTCGTASGSILVEDAQVNGLGNIYLCENTSSNTAWAVLIPSPSADCVSNDTCTTWPDLAEIFYGPPEGGPEQYSVVDWDGLSSDIATTVMVPDSGSVKACGGDPSGSGNPFDEDPQGQGGEAQDPIPDSTPPPDNNYIYPDSVGACTLWH